jgi:hypothetical protein
MYPDRNFDPGLLIAVRFQLAARVATGLPAPPGLRAGTQSRFISEGVLGQVGHPGAEQPTEWRSQNQADEDEDQCHREFVPTALPRCSTAGQSGHAGHGVRWMAGDCLSAKVNSPPTCGR